MKIFDALDLLPVSWSEDVKSKIITWGIIAVLLFFVARLTYLISELSEQVNNHGNNIYHLNKSLDSANFILHKRDSIEHLKDSTYFHDRDQWQRDEQKKLERWEKWDADNPKYAPD